MRSSITELIDSLGNKTIANYFNRLWRQAEELDELASSVIEHLPLTLSYDSKTRPASKSPQEESAYQEAHAKG